MFVGQPRRWARSARCFSQLGDPRGWTLPAEALALLEPLPPGPELVAALTAVARVETLQGRNEAGIRYAEQALTLAEQLGLEPPARALGSRGLARAYLGDRGGLDDFREAIALATEAGQGRAAAVLINNLGVALWAFEGPMAALEVLDGAIAFAQPEGLARWVDAGDGQQARFRSSTVASSTRRSALSRRASRASGGRTRFGPVPGS